MTDEINGQETPEGEGAQESAEYQVHMSGEMDASTLSRLIGPPRESVPGETDPKGDSDNVSQVDSQDAAATADRGSDASPKEGEETDNPDEAQEKIVEEKKVDSSGNDEIKQMLLDLTKRLDALQQGEKKQEQEPEKKADEGKPAIREYATQEEFLASIEDVNAFNGIMTKVHNAAVEETMRTIPDMLNQLVPAAVGMILVTHEFFVQNSDLEPHRAELEKYLGVEGQKDQQAPYRTLLQRAGESLRKAKGLPAPAADRRRIPASAARPAFAAQPATGARTTASEPVMDRQQELIRQMVGLNKK